MAKSADIMNPIPRKCSVEGCDREIGPKGAKGFCSAHYKQHTAEKPLTKIRSRAKLGQRTICRVSGCISHASHFGMCVGHWQRQKRGASLEGIGTRKGEARRFLEQVVLPTRQKECLFWPYAKSDGRGVITIDYVRHIVSRYVCEKRHGPPPFEGASACHKCGRGNEGCVNPDCMYWGSHSQNMLDRRAHGTSYSGIKNHFAKLTDDQVSSILADAREPNLIAKSFGCSVGHVRSIKNGGARSLATGLHRAVKPRAKIPADVAQRILTDARSHRKIAMSFGVGRAVVARIKRGKAKSEVH
jgi:hypothetical protein